MRTRTTVLLFLLVVGLGVVILGIEKYLPSTQELAEMKRGPLRFPREEVTRIEIDTEGSESLNMELKNGHWWSTRPFSDLMDGAKVTKLMDDLLAIGWIERVHQDEFDQAEWTKTLLDRPAYKVRLFKGNEKVAECWVGAPAAIEGSLYISLLPTGSQKNPVHYVARSSVVEVLKTSTKNWRDPKLLNVLENSIKSIKLTQRTGQIEITRDAAKSPWRLIKPLTTRGSKERINELVSTIINLEVTDAVEPPASASSKTTSGSVAEAVSEDLKISITVAGVDAPFELTLKKPADKQGITTATSSQRTPIFTVSSRSLDTLWAEPNGLRDRKLARIGADEVTAVDMTSRSYPPIALRKEGDSWFLQRHGKLVPANGVRMARFFEDLNNHEIREFTSDSAANLEPYGLNQPFQTISWTNVGETKPVRLLLGHNAESTAFYAKYEDEPSVVRIDSALLPVISPDGIKWKGLAALRFSQFALRSISLGAGSAPPVILNYDPVTAQWTATRAGRDITNLLDRVKADKLAGLLGKLSVQDWVAERSEALQALANPLVRIEVTLGEAGRNDGPTKVTTLNFAPTQAGMTTTAFYFGRLNDDPDVFYIAKENLMALVASVLKEPS